MTTATDSHSEYEIRVAFFFRGNSGHANAPKWYVTRRLPVLLLIVFISVLYAWPFTSFVVAAFSRVSHWPLVSPAAVPILTPLDAFKTTKKADCIPITSAELRRRTVRESVSMWRWLLLLLTRGSRLPRWSYCGSRGKRSAGLNSLYLTHCGQYSIGSSGKDIRCMVFPSYVRHSAVFGVKHGNSKSIYLLISTNLMH